MPGPAATPWRKPVLKLLRLGLLTVAEAARIAGVSTARIWQWCQAAGFDPRAAREKRLAGYYAKELVKMTRRDFSKLRHRGRQLEDGNSMPPFMAPLIKRPTRKASMTKAQMRELADQAIIDFQARKRAMRKD